MHINNCDSYNSSEECINCKVTYELYDKKCYIEINGCEQYDSNGCTKCDNGYDMQNEKCYLHIDGCD